jgi:hypothetical protein
MRTTSGLRVVLPLAALLAAAGCGSSGSGSGSGSSPGTSRSSTAPPSTTASAPAPGAQTPVPAESNPPGDIPDNLAFVSYTNAKGGYRFTHPEGWAQTVKGTQVTFTEKLNGVQVAVSQASQAPTVASARRDDVPRLQQSEAAFELRSIKAVTLPAGPAVLITFRRNSAPDPVTGRQYRDEVQLYEVWHQGRLVRLELFGVVGADNVDAYRTMSQSLRLS